MFSVCTLTCRLIFKTVFYTAHSSFSDRVEQLEVGVAEINSQLCSAMFSIVLAEAEFI